MIKAPVFVVGVPRSGTTLLQSLLSASPDAYSLPETHFFPSVMSHLSKAVTQPLTEDDLSAALAILKNMMALEIAEQQLEILKMRVSKGDLTGQDLFNFVLDWYRPLGDHANKLRVIEKTPEHIEYMSEIHALYPDGKFICIVRDPRDTISSWINTPFARTKWLPFCTQYWNMAIGLMNSFAVSNPKLARIVRYEDLIETPAETIQQLCAFLHITYHSEMLNSFARKANQIILEHERSWKRNLESRTIEQLSGVWRQRLTDGEAWFIEWQTSRGMRQYNYRRWATPLLRAKIEIWWRMLRQPSHDLVAMNACLWLASRGKSARDRQCVKSMTLYAICNGVRKMPAC